MFDLPSEISSSRYYISCQILYLLGTLDVPSYTINTRGILVSQIPVDTHLASFLLFAREMGCIEDALTIAAFSSVSHLYKEEPKDHEQKTEYEKTMGELIDERGDQFTYLKIRDYLLNPPVLEGETPIHRDPSRLTGREIAQFCEEYYLNPLAVKKALEIRLQYKYFVDLLPEDAVRSLSDGEQQSSDDDPIMQCLVKAYFRNICQLSSNGCYVPVYLLNENGVNEGDIKVELYPESVLHFLSRPIQWVLFKDIRFTNAIYIRDVCQVNPLMVKRIIPQFYKSYCLSPFSVGQPQRRTTKQSHLDPPCLDALLSVPRYPPARWAGPRSMWRVWVWKTVLRIFSDFELFVPAMLLHP